MPISAAQARQSHGRFERSGQPGQASARRSRYARFRGDTATLRIDRGLHLFIGALLLNTHNVTASVARSPSAEAADARASTGTATLLPGTFASGVLQRAAQPRATPLSALANGALAICMARPRSCGSALIGSGLMMAATGATMLLDGAPRAPAIAPATVQPERSDVLLDAVDDIVIPGETPADTPRLLQEVLVDIARRCAGDRQCRADEINAVLRKLPGTTLAMLQHMVDATASRAYVGFPPGADALPIGNDVLQMLAAALADIYTPDVARYQDDMESIVAAGLEAGDDTDAANENRLQAIRRLLERDGHRVDAQAFRIADRVYPDIMHDGINLLATPGEMALAPASRRLLLVAHGDVAGAAAGSHGAYDNASGVAAVLHVMRQTGPGAHAGGARVQALITAGEERGLLGSSAFVEGCVRRNDCPTLVLNVDMVGRGGHDYVLSGSDLLAGHFYVGRPPMNLTAPSHDPLEAAAADLLQAQFAAQGFSRQPPGIPPVLASDHLSFQNASIPALGLAQMSRDDAAALRDIQRARAAYEEANNAVDWSLYAAHHEGRVVLTPAHLARYRSAIVAADLAWDRYLALREKAAGTSSQIIHRGTDQLHRVNPRMAMDFSRALSAFVNHWTTASAADASGTPPVP